MALEFVRHGRYFAVGDVQGRVSILKSDTLDEVKSFVLEESTASITALHWSSYLGVGTDATSPLPRSKSKKPSSTETTDNPLDFSFHLKKLEGLNPNLSQAAKGTLALLSDCGVPPAVLVACDTNGTVQMMFNGNFPLCRFSLRNLLESKEAEDLPSLGSFDSLRVKKVQLSRDWTEMGLLVNFTAAGEGEDVFLAVDTEAL
mmetsp:Transcript_20759/g.28025  ORF Transcript_20759/g.28025 Transcript_20759/m.28025 type:complete len:202 (+) Transcript_20759:134-739(+)|eukprot:CAMPEP_0185593874 /NCGR_PEP_ID=MMETSP0434-20130131/72921_1 /TAXON_ID=626734 ORGANISM="Favella taraikaensis, Strain Fe Narragansett Bay" /NCGR_SAMPLE_ID=MMETSP0434 /ASSEMBLY_ACC=CAM_ASM_000379 /LENGTH=201 /DNA_ID=CAMNT_0028220797 /DNA_START=113 /DNA_END=718 /DNA_ORIENTATION=+